jgi:hypothetical protein
MICRRWVQVAQENNANRTEIDDGCADAACSPSKDPGEPFDLLGNVTDKRRLLQEVDIAARFGSPEN